MNDDREVFWFLAGFAMVILALLGGLALLALAGVDIS